MLVNLDEISAVVCVCVTLKVKVNTYALKMGMSEVHCWFNTPFILLKLYFAIDTLISM